MATFVRKRFSRGQWIVRLLADHADIRTPLDALCFIGCGVAVAGLFVAALICGGVL